MDVNFQGEVEDLFRSEFLKAAPLYAAAKKINLPYEDKKQFTSLYRGSLSEQTRVVEEIADYHIFKDEPYTPATICNQFARLAKEAGHAIEGLIRIENGEHDPDHDVRSPHIRVIDIFEHSDGRRNLQLMRVNTPSPSLNGPDATIPPWIAYRFYFAAANVRTEYKKT
jgi:hypothetical protein